MIVPLSTDVPLPSSRQGGLHGVHDRWYQVTGTLAAQTAQKAGQVFMKVFQDYNHGADNLTPMLGGLSKLSIEAFNAFMVTLKKSGGMELGPGVFAMRDTFRAANYHGR
ncbi:MAG: hypothetical protein LBK60_11295 [Verrucomicrobiales bacterium]|jgi:hypothetical protein|nr:hypothetical protein [Verrucomicrobiales bacterium]